MYKKFKEVMKSLCEFPILNLQFWLRLLYFKNKLIIKSQYNILLVYKLLLEKKINKYETEKQLIACSVSQFLIHKILSIYC